MKRAFSIALALTLSAGLTAATRDTLQLSRISQSASLPIENSTVQYSLYAQWPATDSILGKALTAWTQTLMADMTGIAPTDGMGLLSPTVQTGFVAQSAKDLTRLNALMKREHTEVTPRNYLCDLSLKKVAETKDFITYQLVAELYTGGAHGMHYRHYGTFRKKDGHLLTWNDVIATKRKAHFSQAVADGLKSFFGVQTFKDMQQRLQIEGSYSRTNFPLPATHPAFTGEGLIVQYQYYEIAAYANGAPTVTLPYATIQRDLTSLGQKAARR